MHDQDDRFEIETYRNIVKEKTNAILYGLRDILTNEQHKAAERESESRKPVDIATFIIDSIDKFNEHNKANYAAQEREAKLITALKIKTGNLK